MRTFSKSGSANNQKGLSVKGAGVELAISRVVGEVVTEAACVVIADVADLFVVDTPDLVVVDAADLVFVDTADLVVVNAADLSVEASKGTQLFAISGR